MARPSLFFVYEWATIGNDTHAKCICCSADSMHPRDGTDPAPAVVLPGGPTFQLSQLLSDRIPYAVPAGAEELYAKEAFIEVAPSWAHPLLDSMQNATFVLIAGCKIHATRPFFVATESFMTPCNYKATVRMCVEGVANLPDIVLYLEKIEQYLRRPDADRFDAMMYDPESFRGNVAIPVGAYLPAMIERSGREYQVVYRIDSYSPSNLTSMTLYFADNSTPVGPGTVLRRRRREIGVGSLTKDVAIIETIGSRFEEGVE